MLLPVLACLFLVAGVSLPGTCGDQTKFGGLQPGDVERNPAARDVILEINRELFSASEKSLLLEGDILRRRPISTFAAIDMKWPKVDGFVKVPYTLSPLYDTDMKNLVHEAFAVFSASTCVRFVERTKERDYISIVPLYGCYSSIGRVGRMQILSLASTCFKVGKGVALHELMHALGFWHEHSRADREKYIDIVWTRILAGYEINFRIYNTTNMLVDYDLLSILHYARIAFSKTGADTIIPKTPYSQAHIGQRIALSASDVLRVNKYYSCPQAGTPTGDDMQVEHDFPVFPNRSCQNVKNDMLRVAFPDGADGPKATSLKGSTVPAAKPSEEPTVSAAQHKEGVNVSTDISSEGTPASALKVTVRPTALLDSASLRTKVTYVLSPDRPGSLKNVSPLEKGNRQWVMASPEDQSSNAKGQLIKESATAPQETAGSQSSNPRNPGNKAIVMSLHETTPSQTSNTPKLRTIRSHSLWRRAARQEGAPRLPKTQYNNHLRDRTSGIWYFNIPMVRSIDELATRNLKFVGHRSFLRDLNRQPASKSTTFQKQGVKRLKVLGSRQTKRSSSQVRDMDSGESSNRWETLKYGLLDHVRQQRASDFSPSWNIQQRPSIRANSVTSSRQGPLLSPCINCLTAPTGSTNLYMSKSGVIRSALTDPVLTISTQSPHTVPSVLSSLFSRVGGLVSRMEMASSSRIELHRSRSEPPPMERLVSGSSSHSFCDFEILCRWKVTSAGDSRWTYRKDNWIIGGPASYRHKSRIGDGPPAGHYISLKPSSENRVTAQRAALISPILKGPGCLSFWYRLQGSIGGTIHINVRFVPSPGAWRRLWVTRGQQGTRWVYTEVTLSEMHDKEVFQVMLEGVVGSAPGSEIAIDNLRLRQRPCAEAGIDLVDETETGS